jgi:hypothetical protein
MRGWSPVCNLASPASSLTQRATEKEAYMIPWPTTKKRCSDACKAISTPTQDSGFYLGFLVGGGGGGGKLKHCTVNTGQEAQALHSEYWAGSSSTAQ